MKHLITASLLALTASAWAQNAAHVDIKDPWVRATVAQQKSTGAFMQLTAQQDAKLVAAQSPVAGVVQIHEMAMENNVMKMREVPAVALPAGKAVELKPGGYHVMLLDLKAPVKNGDTVPLTLVFETKDGKRENVQLQVPTRALNSGAGMSGGAAMPMADHGTHKH